MLGIAFYPLGTIYDDPYDWEAGTGLCSGRGVLWAIHITLFEVEDGR